MHVAAAGALRLNHANGYGKHRNEDNCNSLGTRGALPFRNSLARSQRKHLRLIRSSRELRDKDRASELEYF